ncbi:hypothetical protein DMB42_42235 [Nonomuraea sp. WAC 01424]|nr:hypothetical protein DMB42_42235 [Nonomuraea sp. WAC 01424]
MRASTSLDLVVACVVGAFMARLTTWVDGGDHSATPAELEVAFRATVVPGARGAGGAAVMAAVIRQRCGAA